MHGAHATEIRPGSTCPSCARRVPYPKTASSPGSKTAAYRIPIDDVAVHDANLEAAARHLGIHDKPYWKFWTVNYGLALILQGPPKEMG